MQGFKINAYIPQGTVVNTGSPAVSARTNVLKFYCGKNVYMRSISKTDEE